MVKRVKAWLAEGKDVRIFTARVCATGRASEYGMADGEFVGDQLMRIQAWCTEHLGIALPVTCTKDFEMIELWDDRCVQVIPNTGLRADGGGL